MTSQNVSNDMIYELVKAQDRNLQLIDKRLDQIDKRLDRLDDKMDHVDQRLRHVENSIDGIRISWSTRLVSSILGTSAITSAVVAYFISSIL